MFCNYALLTEPSRIMRAGKIQRMESEALARISPDPPLSLIDAPLQLTSHFLYRVDKSGDWSEPDSCRF